MPMIDIQTAIAWAKARWPSPVVRRPVDDLLAHCPTVEGELLGLCKGCKGAEPIAPPLKKQFGDDKLRCILYGAFVSPDDYCSNFASIDGGINDENT